MRAELAKAMVECVRAERAYDLVALAFDAAARCPEAIRDALKKIVMLPKPSPTFCADFAEVFPQLFIHVKWWWPELKPALRHLRNYEGPAPLIVWRGERRGVTQSAMGVCWSTDEDTAWAYALSGGARALTGRINGVADPDFERDFFPMIRQSDRVVLQATAPREACLFVVESTGESEVVLDPDRLLDVRVIFDVRTLQGWIDQETEGKTHDD